MYVFPGIGLGAILCKAVSITQPMIYASGESLSTALLESEIAENWLYPDIRRIREVSVVVTRGVIRAAQRENVDRELILRNMPDDELDEYIRRRMYNPHHPNEISEEVQEIANLVNSHKTNGTLTNGARPVSAKGDTKL